MPLAVPGAYGADDMSTTLFFLVPIGMLAVAWSLCFVGCALQTHGLGEGTPYSNAILAEQSLVAYWPLNDFPNTTPPAPAPSPPQPPQNSTSLGGAIDLSKGGHTGGYFIPPAYPPTATFPLSMSFANPALTLRQSSIVPGDVSNSDNVDQNLFAASADFEGGYVSIPWAADSLPMKNFTVEAWVRPNWTQTQANFRWVVFGAVTPTAGFVLFVNENNNWALAIGDGTTNNLFDTMVPAAVKPSASTPAPVTYVAATYGQDNFLRLWINPQFGPEPDTSNPMPVPPNPTWTSPTTVVYSPVDPTQQPLTFFIGAGYNDQLVRTQAGVVGAPLYPFQGQIQSVALYQAALDPIDLATHFSDGS
jgi:hypothetical protein